MKRTLVLSLVPHLQPHQSLVKLPRVLCLFWCWSCKRFVGVLLVCCCCQCVEAGGLSVLVIGEVGANRDPSVFGEHCPRWSSGLLVF